MYDYSRVAYVEAHDDETATTLVWFWRRAQGWFWANDMDVDEVLTDNGPNVCFDAFAEVLAERSIVHRRTRLYRVHDYNCRRHHTAVRGPPVSHVNNLTRTDS